MNMRVVGFLPTPFARDGSIDSQAIQRLVRKYVGNGITPAVLGGMGEFYALSRDESKLVMEAAVEAASGHPVYAGVGFATREAAQLAKEGASVGIGGLVANPHYYIVPTPNGIGVHVRKLFDESGLPVTVYSSAVQPVTERHLEALVSVEGFVGVKEEHYGPDETSKRIADWGDRVTWWGVGELGGMEYVRVGAQVITSGLANVAPRFVRRYVDAALRGEDLKLYVDALSEWQSFLSSNPEGAPSALKAMMSVSDGWNVMTRAPVLNPSQRVLENAKRLLSLIKEADV